MTTRSDLPLRGLDPRRRQDAIAAAGIIAAEDLSLFQENTLLDWAEKYGSLIENAIGAVPVPLGLAGNFIVNGQDRLIAMATEERSVVAAASKAAKLCRPLGFSAVCVRTGSVAQILYAGLEQPEAAAVAVEERLGLIRAEIRAKHDTMAKRGGGLREIWTRMIPGARGRLLLVELSLDPDEAMGANAVTRMAEKVAELLEPVIGRRRTAAICDNRRSGWRVRASAVWPNACFADGLAERILDLQAWAEGDPCRAVTHNKGIMNGVIAVALATGQDTRAIEAANHAHAVRAGDCRPLSAFGRDRNGDLWGKIDLLLPVGTVGGATGHPVAACCRRLMGVGAIEDAGADPARRFGLNNAGVLAQIIGAVGLAQNFAALRSLADEGLPAGHSRLARNR